MSETTSRVKPGLTAAEREIARFNLLTPAAVAARLSESDVNEETVRSWCAAGWLRSVDARRPGSRAARYLIEWAWVQEFVANGGAAAFVQKAKAS